MSWPNTYAPKKPACEPKYTVGKIKGKITLSSEQEELFRKLLYDSLFARHASNGNWYLFYFGDFKGYYRLVISGTDDFAEPASRVESASLTSGEYDNLVNYIQENGKHFIANGILAGD